MITDKIEQEIKKFVRQHERNPDLLILDRVSYAALLDARDIIDGDIQEYAGVEVVIEPKDEGHVRVI